MLSKSADYGLRALIHLARRPGNEFVSLPELASAIRTPPYFLGRVLHRLVRAEILVSVPGHNGGFRLQRDPRRIHVAEAVHGIDGPLRTFDCSATTPCGLANGCGVVALFAKAGKAFEAVLSATTIADLATHASASELVAFVSSEATDSIHGGC